MTPGQRLFLFFAVPAHPGGRAPADIDVLAAALRFKVTPDLIRRTDPEAIACAAALDKLSEAGLEEVAQMDARDRRWIVLLHRKMPEIQQAIAKREAEEARKEAERRAQSRQIGG